MESACLRHTEIPHTSRLFSDHQYHFDRVKKYFAHDPHDPASYPAAARRIDYPEKRRAALVSALRARNGDSASLRTLARPETVAVVTGQQVGLFSGPAYTIYKALTAVRLARRLTEQGQPAVPVFWLATEDHDLAEVNHALAFGRDHQPVRLETAASGAAQQPVGSIRMEQPPVAELRRLLEAFPFGAEVADRVARSYADGATLGESFEGLLRSLLDKWGILYLDPLDQGIRAIAAPFLSEAVLRAGELKSKVLERNKELEADGYHAQVHVEAQTSFFFRLEGERRVTLRLQNGTYLSKERSYSAAELAGHGEQLSPNALLRPVVQDYLLPTIAYVGGPAELAYLAQSRVIYDEMLGRMPVALARGSFTLLEPRAQKLLDRYHLSLPALFHGDEQVRERIASQLVPRELAAEFAKVRKNAGQDLDRLGAGLSAFDPTLAAALQKSRVKMEYQLGKLQRKTAREALRRDERAAEEARYLSGLIFPEKHLQERYYSILPFLAKHGFELLDTIYDAVHLECPDHKILVV